MNPNKSVNRKTRLRWNRSFVLAASVLALLLGIVGASLAYLRVRQLHRGTQVSAVPGSQSVHGTGRF